MFPALVSSLESYLLSGNYQLVHIENIVKSHLQTEKLCHSYGFNSEIRGRKLCGVGGTMQEIYGLMRALIALIQGLNLSRILDNLFLAFTQICCLFYNKFTFPY